MNDVFILFGMNLANVAVSLGTTIGAMRAARAAATALRLEQAALGIEVKKTAFSFSMLGPNLHKARIAFIGAKFSVTGLKWAFKSLYFAMGPVGIAMVGITTALGFLLPHLEEGSRDLFGMSDSLSEVESKLGETTAGVEGLDSALQDLNGTTKGTANDALPYMIAMQNSYLRSLNGTTQAVYDQIEANKQLASSKPSGFSTPSALTAGGTGVGTGTPSGYQSGTTAEPTTTSSVISPRGAVINPVTSSKVEEVVNRYRKTPRGTLPQAPIITTPEQISRLDIYGGTKTGAAPDPRNLGFGTFGSIVDQFEKDKQSMKSKIESLRTKAQQGTISDMEMNDLQVLNVQYMAEYQNKTIDRFTGQTITSAGVSQTQMIEDWSKGLSFKLDPSKTSTTQDFRDAAGYQVDRDFKDSLFAKVMRGEDLTIDEWFDFMSDHGGQEGYGRKIGEKAFPYGTNTGGGATQAVNTLLGYYGLSGAELRNYIGYTGGFKGIKTFEEQKKIADKQRRLYGDQGFGQIALTRGNMINQNLGQEALADFARRDTSAISNALKYAQSITQTAFTEGVTRDERGYITDPNRQKAPAQFQAAQGQAQWLGRMTWYKEQNKNYTIKRGGSGHSIVNHYVRNAVNDEDRQAMTNLANSHDQQVREYGEEAFERGKDLDILWLKIQTINQAKALNASISIRVTAERATALEFGNQLGISQNEALAILRDKSQGEQTLNDMLAYQQRLDAMSSGVV